MTWWIWTLIAFLFLTLEFFASTLHLAFFSAGAFLVALLVGFGIGGPLWAQILIFAVFSLITLLLIRPWAVQRLGLNVTKTVDTMMKPYSQIGMRRVPGSGDRETRPPARGQPPDGSAVISSPAHRLILLSRVRCSRIHARR